MNGTERVQPSSAYYFLAAAVFLAGIASMSYSILSGIQHVRAAMVRGEIPGQLDLELKQQENYTV